MPLKATLLALFLFLGGCATVIPVSGPDGHQNELIKCDQAEFCYNKASEICGGPYNIINTFTAPVAGGGSNVQINMLISCPAK